MSLCLTCLSTIFQLLVDVGGLIIIKLCNEKVMFDFLPRQAG